LPFEGSGGYITRQTESQSIKGIKQKQKLWELIEALYKVLLPSSNIDRSCRISSCKKKEEVPMFFFA